jgi:predicted  nucleic acid-binding Zn-ribbon protein
MSTDSDSGATALDFGDGAKGRMHDVDDKVLISMSNIETDKYKLTATPETESSTDPTLPVTFNLTSSGGAATSDSGEGVHSDDTARESLRQGTSGPCSSEERTHSGLGIVQQAQPTSMSQDKVLHGEDSIRLLEYQRKLSRASSSGSSFDKLPPARYRGDSTSSTDLKKLHDEEVTALTKQLSTAEDEVQKLKKENEKLERKLKEAEEVAHQAGAAATEVSRLEAELEKEKDANTKMLRARTTSPDPAGDDACISLMLSQELESVKTQLAVEVQEKNSLEQQMTNLKQSLVVSGKGDIVKRNEVISDLQAKVRELEKRVEEKDSDIKRQYHVHTRTVSDLQAKLSKERQQREELLQSARNGARPASSEATTTSRDTAAVTEPFSSSVNSFRHLTRQQAHHVTLLQ